MPFSTSGVVFCRINSRVLLIFKFGNCLFVEHAS
jgi:hypothetical protein